MSQIPREVELKLDIDPADVPRIKRYFSRLSRTRPVGRLLVSAYFDTPSLTLHESGLSLRVRRIGRKYVQTIKLAAGPAAGLYNRAEWERAIRGPQPDLSLARGTALGSLLHGKLANSLAPVFETRIRRTTYWLASDGVRIAVTMDQGVVQAGRRRAAVCELEFELLKGDVGGLFAAARALGDLAPVRLSVKTKADRGYDLLRRKDSTSKPPEMVNVSLRATAGDAFQAIGRGCLRQLIANEKAVLAGDGEALHQMRIALRRLRAAISVFSEVVGDKDSERLKVNLRQIGGELGWARDLDVYSADVLTPWRERYGQEPGVKSICRDFERRRALAYKRVAASIQSARFRNQVLDTAQWIEEGPWIKSRYPAARLRRHRRVTLHAAEELARRRKKLIKAGRNVRELSDMARHRLRIRAKTLRYATEFFAGLFQNRKAGTRSREALSALKVLQHSLGALNDIAKRESLASDIIGPRQQASAGPGPASKALANRVLFSAQTLHVDRLLDRTEGAYARFSEVKPFWD
jgi:inorganic triphosphatase YgiF